MKYGPINIDPETMGGTPVFTCTRVPIQALFDYIGTGETLDEFLENFPSVKKNLLSRFYRWLKSQLQPKKSLMKILLDGNIAAKKIIEPISTFHSPYAFFHPSNFSSQNFFPKHL